MCELLRCLKSWCLAVLPPEEKSLTSPPSHWLYCAFDSDHYHGGFIVLGIWQTKSRKWLGVTQGIWRGMWGRVPEKGCECHQDRGGRQTSIYCMFQCLQFKKEKTSEPPLCTSLHQIPRYYIEMREIREDEQMFQDCFVSAVRFF